MPVAVTVILFVFWVAVAYREFQRGDLLLGVVFLAVGIALTVYRLRAAKKLPEAFGDQTSSQR